MTSNIINGRQLANNRQKLLSSKVKQFIKQNRRPPSLLAVKIADDLGSNLYLKLKAAAAKKLGIIMKVSRSQKPNLHYDGIMVQHPPGIEKTEWFAIVDQLIPPDKDVDCLTSTNLEMIKSGQPHFLPATVKAIGYCLVHALNKTTSLLSLQKGCLRNRKVVVIGRSPIVGQPLAWWLANLGAKITVCHSKTADLTWFTNQADVLISAVGKPNLITADMVKPGSIIIDAGAPQGDVQFDSVQSKVAAITPVPGGIGPLTVVSLMENVLQAANSELGP